MIRKIPILINFTKNYLISKHINSNTGGETIAEETKEEQKPEGKEIGAITHYFDHINVAVLEIKNGILKVGDTIHIKGHATDVSQEVDSMQIEHENVDEAKAGQSIGMKVKERVREHDKVYKV